MQVEQLHVKDSNTEQPSSKQLNLGQLKKYILSSGLDQASDTDLGSDPLENSSIILAFEDLDGNKSLMERPTQVRLGIAEVAARCGTAYAMHGIAEPASTRIWELNAFLHCTQKMLEMHFFVYVDTQKGKICTCFVCFTTVPQLQHSSQVIIITAGSLI